MTKAFLRRIRTRVLGTRVLTVAGAAVAVCAGLGTTGGAQAPAERRLVVVLDASFSMVVREGDPRADGPTRFAIACADVRETLERLAGRIGGAFALRLVVFGPPGSPAGDGCWHWPAVGERFASLERRADAAAWLEHLATGTPASAGMPPLPAAAPRGPSHLERALERAFALSADHVLCYTDGVPVEPRAPGGAPAAAEAEHPEDVLAAARERILTRVREWDPAGRVRLDVVGVGAALQESRAFLRTLATEHGGYFVPTGAAAGR